MILVPRETIWPGQLPTNSTGTPRPLLAPNRPYLTIHYTGAGLWLDPDDSPTELRAIQAYAKNAGKPWEYNYVVDGQGIVFEYAGEYKAAHAGDPNNTNTIGVLLLVGLASSVYEKPTEEMIAAVRDLRVWLVDGADLAANHQMLQHRQMPNAKTMCPGPEVIARWADLTAPPPPPPPPPQGDDVIIPYIFGNKDVGKYGAVPHPQGGCSLFVLQLNGTYRSLGFGEWVALGTPMGIGLADSVIDLLPRG